MLCVHLVLIQYKVFFLHEVHVCIQSVRLRKLYWVMDARMHFCETLALFSTALIGETSILVILTRVGGVSPRLVAVSPKTTKSCRRKSALIDHGARPFASATWRAQRHCRARARRSAGPAACSSPIHLPGYESRLSRLPRCQSHYWRYEYDDGHDWARMSSPGRESSRSRRSPNCFEQPQPNKASFERSRLSPSNPPF